MKTWKCYTACLLLTIFVAPSLAQKTSEELPSGEEVIAKFIEATGGADAYKSVKTRVVTGTMDMKAAGISGKITGTTASDGKFYTEVDMEGIGTEKMGSDGETYWSASNFTGTRVLEGSERDMQALENDLTSILHPKKYYKSMKVTGIEKVDEDDCYRVEKIKKDGDELVDFYSVKTGLLTKMVVLASTPLGKINIEVIPSDYRKVGGGLLMSHASRQNLPGNMVQEIKIEKVELNKEIDPETFELPDDVKKLLAKKAEKEAEKAKDAE